MRADKDGLGKLVFKRFKIKPDSYLPPKNDQPKGDQLGTSLKKSPPITKKSQEGTLLKEIQKGKALKATPKTTAAITKKNNTFGSLMEKRRKAMRDTNEYQPSGVPPTSNKNASSSSSSSQNTPTPARKNLKASKGSSFSSQKTLAAVQPSDLLAAIKAGGRELKEVTTKDKPSNYTDTKIFDENLIEKAQALTDDSDDDSDSDDNDWNADSDDDY